MTENSYLNLTADEVVFKAYEWNLSNEDESREIFYISGLTPEGKSVIVRVEDFTPFVQIELPPRIKWEKEKQFLLFEYIKNNLQEQYTPIKYSCKTKYSLMHKKKGFYMTCVFPNQAACRNCQYLFSRRKEIPGIGYFEKDEIRVHEQNVDPIIKMTAVRKLPLAGWIKAKRAQTPEDEGLSPEEQRFSNADIDMCASFRDLSPIDVPDTVQPKLKIMSWDIETYSKNHNSKIPNPQDIHNSVIQISVIVAHTDDPPEKWKKHLLTLKKGYTFELPNTKILFYETEKALLLGFTKIVQQINPDILLGYNILKFDWDYLIKRADIHGILPQFLEMGRVNGLTAVKVTKNWGSSAYGTQNFEYIECQGRMNLDLLPEIERNYKFDTYSLNAVSKHFLGEEKRDMPVKQLFNLYKFSTLTKNYFDYEMTEDFLRDIKKISEHVFQDDEEGISHEYALSIKNSTVQNVKENMSKAMQMIGDYCVHDSFLTLKLLFKLKTVYNLVEMGKLFCVPMTYLQTRGQQVKILAQVYRKTLYSDIVIPFKNYTEENDEPYQGASVVDAIPGYYINTATLDFASLYPSIMIANNIDHTSYVDDSDPKSRSIPDSDCTVIEFTNHVGCEHDPQGRKKKKEKILCGHHRYRFLKEKGVLPSLLEELLAARKKVKGEMKDVAKLLSSMKEDTQERRDLDVRLVVLDAKQLAVKVSANSMYGTLGARTGPFPLIEGAASVTAKGREYIHIAINYVIKNFNVHSAQLVYGDSVTGDTPILCRIISDRVVGNLGPRQYLTYKTIEQISNGKWFSVLEKQYSAPIEGIEVWTESGFTKIKNVIRHRTTKDIIRVVTNCGSEVDVTTDHSLLTMDGNKISPKKLRIGNKIMHANFPSSSFDESFEDHGERFSGPQIDLKTLTKLERAKYFYLKNHCVPLTDDDYKISQLINLGQTRQPVYDLETENHHFSAGIGKIIVHNTDSCMIVFKSADTKQTFELAKKAARDVTALFPRPVELTFECVYGKFLLLTKKRYIAYKIDEEGKVLEEIKKGVVLKRRDNTKFLKNVYHDMIESIMKQEPEQAVFYNLYDHINSLFTRQIQAKDLVIYKGIGDLISYAKTIELPHPKGEKDEKGNVKMISYFIGKDKKPLMDEQKRPYTTRDPLDPNLRYDNTAHLMLALRMKQRGDEVPPNTRLEYLFLETDNPEDLQGDKTEDFTYYKENKNIMKFRLDPLYYLEKQLTVPISELIGVLYRRDEYLYETIETRINNRETFIFKTVDSSIKESLEGLKKMMLAFNNPNPIPYSKRISMVYTQIKKMKNEALCKRFEELIQLYFKKKSEMFLDKIEKKYGIKKRPPKKIDKKTGMTIKDGLIMDDILKYRTIYKSVVKHLDWIFFLKFEN